MDIATKCQTHSAQRLIDANTLVASEEVQKKGCAYIEEINAAPTVEKRVHGKWLTVIDADDVLDTMYDFYVCNQCGLLIAIDHRYCPNCGAKMDGERSEE